MKKFWICVGVQYLVVHTIVGSEFLGVGTQEETALLSGEETMMNSFRKSDRKMDQDVSESIFSASQEVESANRHGNAFTDKDYFWPFNKGNEFQNISNVKDTARKSSPMKSNLKSKIFADQIQIKNRLLKSEAVRAHKKEIRKISEEDLSLSMPNSLPEGGGISLPNLDAVKAERISDSSESSDVSLQRCSHDWECLNTFACIKKECVKRKCYDDSDCNKEGEICLNMFECIKGTRLDRECSEDNDCKYGQCDTLLNTCVRLSATKNKLKLVNSKEINYINSSKVFTEKEKEQLMRISKNKNASTDMLDSVANILEREFNLGEKPAQILKTLIDLSEHHSLSLLQLMLLIYSHFPERVLQVMRQMSRNKELNSAKLEIVLLAEKELANGIEEANHFKMKNGQTLKLLVLKFMSKSLIHFQDIPFMYKEPYQVEYVRTVLLHVISDAIKDNMDSKVLKTLDWSEFVDAILQYEKDINSYWEAIPVNLSGRSYQLSIEDMEKIIDKLDGRSPTSEDNYRKALSDVAEKFVGKKINWSELKKYFQFVLETINQNNLDEVQARNLIPTGLKGTIRNFIGALISSNCSLSVIVPFTLKNVVKEYLDYISTPEKNMTKSIKIIDDLIDDESLKGISVEQKEILHVKLLTNLVNQMGPIAAIRSLRVKAPTTVKEVNFLLNDNSPMAVLEESNSPDYAGVQGEPEVGHETFLSLEAKNGGIRNSEVGERQISHNVHTKKISEKIIDATIDQTTQGSKSTKKESVSEKLIPPRKDQELDASNEELPSQRIPTEKKVTSSEHSTKAFSVEEKSQNFDAKKKEKAPSSISSKCHESSEDCGSKSCQSQSECGVGFDCLDHKCEKKRNLKFGGKPDYEDAFKLKDDKSIEQQANKLEKISEDYEGNRSSENRGRTTTTPKSTTKACVTSLECRTEEEECVKKKCVKKPIKMSSGNTLDDVLAKFKKTEDASSEAAKDEMCSTKSDCKKNQECNDNTCIYAPKVFSTGNTHVDVLARKRKPEENQDLSDDKFCESKSDCKSSQEECTGSKCILTDEKSSTKEVKPSMDNMMTISTQNSVLTKFSFCTTAHDCDSDQDECLSNKCVKKTDTKNKLSKTIESEQSKEKPKLPIETTTMIPSCNFDSDCEKYFICVANKCRHIDQQQIFLERTSDHTLESLITTPLSDDQIECNSNSDCKSNEECIERHCLLVEPITQLEEPIFPQIEENSQNETKNIENPTGKKQALQGSEYEDDKNSLKNKTPIDGDIDQLKGESKKDEDGPTKFEQTKEKMKTSGENMKTETMEPTVDKTESNIAEINLKNNPDEIEITSSVNSSKSLQETTESENGEETSTIEKMESIELPSFSMDDQNKTQKDSDRDKSNKLENETDSVKVTEEQKKKEITTYEPKDIEIEHSKKDLINTNTEEQNKKEITTYEPKDIEIEHSKKDLIITNSQVTSGSTSKPKDDISQGTNYTKAIKNPNENITSPVPNQTGDKNTSKNEVGKDGNLREKTHIITNEEINQEVTEATSNQMNKKEKKENITENQDLLEVTTAKIKLMENTTSSKTPEEVKVNRGTKYRVGLNSESKTEKDSEEISVEVKSFEDERQSEQDNIRTKEEGLVHISSKPDSGQESKEKITGEMLSKTGDYSFEQGSRIITTSKHNESNSRNLTTTSTTASTVATTISSTSTPSNNSAIEALDIVADKLPEMDDQPFVIVNGGDDGGLFVKDVEAKVPKKLSNRVGKKEEDELDTFTQLEGSQWSRNEPKTSEDIGEIYVKSMPNYQTLADFKRAYTKDIDPKAMGCKKELEGYGRMVHSKTINFSNFEVCESGKWIEKKCPPGSVYWRLLQCCVSVSKSPCHQNCIDKHSW